MKVRTVALALVIPLAACASNPQRLPVSVSLCNAVPSAGGFTAHTTVQNRSDRPISELAFTMSFYRDFRYASFNASTRLQKELDPGQKREVAFDVANAGSRISGNAMQCLVTHIGYMDGTSADVPPSQ